MSLGFSGPVSMSINRRESAGRMDLFGHTAAILSSVVLRFSFECGKGIGFAFTTLRDWLKKVRASFSSNQD